MLIRPLIPAIVAFAGQAMKIARSGDFSWKIDYDAVVLEVAATGGHRRR